MTLIDYPGRLSNTNRILWTCIIRIIYWRIRWIDCMSIINQSKYMSDIEKNRQILSPRILHPEIIN